ncbi:hypothetical protein NC651_021256 [Populus alba x Populus x berolinensis]|nr:hypothetical protein NC651_021256 [Populus alba x Populus x berolinensis]
MATTIYPRQFLFLLSIFSILHKSISYPGTSSSIINPAKVKQVSWKPRAFVYEGFLTDLECDHLISLAKSELKRSAVADNESGKSKLSEVRTSSGMFITKAKDPIVAGIEDKIATWTFLPRENGEDMQVLRYEHGQKYDPHYDYFSDKVNIARGGHRVATVLMYLTDVEKGGETVFPSAEEPSRRKASVSHEDLSECAKKGVADTSSIHAGCPVIEGEKWSATKWIHVDSFDKNLEAGGNCTDQNESCGRWAALGECTKNVEYMVGSQGLPGYCRRSCKREGQSMEVGQMQRAWVEYTKSLFREGFLDAQFQQLQLLQDESNPDFVAEVVSLFFEDSERLLTDLTSALEQQNIDFKKVDAHVHQFKGSSSSIGALRVKNDCIAFRNFCEEQNIEGCLRCLQQLKQDYYLVKSKLEALIRLEQQIVAACGTIPMEELSS